MENAASGTDYWETQVPTMPPEGEPCLKGVDIRLSELNRRIDRFVQQYVEDREERLNAEPVFP